MSFVVTLFSLECVAVWCHSKCGSLIIESFLVPLLPLATKIRDKKTLSPFVAIVFLEGSGVMELSTFAFRHLKSLI